MEPSVFEQIASSLTVKAICGPLGPDLPIDADDATIEQIFSTTSADPHAPSRVIDSDARVVGVVSLNDLNTAAWEQQQEWEQETGEDCGWMDVEIEIAEIMQPLNPHQFVSSSTTILDAVQLFGSNAIDSFYVLHISDVAGVLRYPHLFKPLGRLAFLALALEIEDQAQRLCSSHRLARDCWRSLSEARRQKARELYDRRYGSGKRLLGGLIASTHLGRGLINAQP